MEEAESVNLSFDGVAASHGERASMFGREGVQKCKRATFSAGCDALLTRTYTSVRSPNRSMIGFLDASLRGCVHQI
eukprot:6181358-Pleurochrysis_carterae.AAC.2